MNLLLYILAGIAVVIGLLLFVRIKIVIGCTESVEAFVKILCIKIPIYPQNKKKVKPSQFKRGYPKEESKKPKKKKQKSSGESSESYPLSEKITKIIELLTLLVKKFKRHLRLELSRMIIVVGGSDAATTAITYGVIAQSAAYLLEFIDNNIKVSKRHTGKIDVLCDFTSEHITCDILISLSLTVWQLLDIVPALAYNYFKGNDVFGIGK